MCAGNRSRLGEAIVPSVTPRPLASALWRLPRLGAWPVKRPVRRLDGRKRNGDTPSRKRLGSRPVSQLGSTKRRTRARFSRYSPGSRTRSSCRRWAFLLHMPLRSGRSDGDHIRGTGRRWRRWLGCRAMKVKSKLTRPINHHCAAGASLAVNGMHILLPSLIFPVPPVSNTTRMEAFKGRSSDVVVPVQADMSC